MKSETSMAAALQIRRVHSRRCWFFTTGKILAAMKGGICVSVALEKAFNEIMWSCRIEI